MRWPWDRQPERPPRDYTEAWAIAALLGAQGHYRATDGRKASAVAVVSTLTGAAFATAEVTAPDAIAAGLDAPTLAVLGRASVTDGEAVFRLSADGGRLRLAPVELLEGLQDGRLRVRTPGPVEDLDVVLPRGEYCRVVLGVEPGSWRAVPAWRRSESVAALAELEAAMRDEGRSPTGLAYVHAAPHQQMALDEAWDRLQMTLLKDMRDARGDVVALPAQADKASNFREDSTPVAARNEGAPRRFGPEFSPAYAEMHGKLFTSSVASLGLPPMMVSGTTPVASFREARRQWLESAIQPALDVAAAQLSAQLDAEIALALPRAASPADVVSRSRAVHSLASAGVGVDEALAIAGITEPAAPPAESA